MKEFVEKLIEKLTYLLNNFGWHCEEWGSDKEGDCHRKACSDCVLMHAIEIVNDLASEHNNGWIPCEVVDHPEHCHDCEVTIKDVYGYTREIAYYTDKWRLLRDETPVMVVAWKEPSAPYKKGE